MGLPAGQTILVPPAFVRKGLVVTLSARTVVPHVCRRTRGSRTGPARQLWMVRTHGMIALTKDGSVVVSMVLVTAQVSAGDTKTA